MNMSFLRWLVFACAIASQALAGETKLSGSDIISMLNDNSLYAGENGETEQIFQKTGLTFFIENGTSSSGGWSVEGDQYCSTWPQGSNQACYDVLRDGDAVTFVSKSGNRYPMRLTK